MEHNITVTEMAMAQLFSIAKDNNVDDVRYFLDGGGCSGLIGRWAIGTGAESGDTVFELGEDKTFLIDSTTIMYMEDATVDFTGDFMPAFKVTIPDTMSCGCGSSFQMNE